MRRAFVRALTQLAALDERVVLLTADLGFSFLEPFRDRFPDRFINVGVAEANMIGLATGLADDGFTPFAYSMAAFLLPRAFEVVRNGPVAHRLPVRIVGVGGGFDYGPNGPSHYALDDLALARAAGHLEVFVPVDAAQAEAALLATRGREAPIYLRLATEARGSCGAAPLAFEPGRAAAVRPRGPVNDACLVALGPSAFDALDAAARLESGGWRTSVVAVSCLRPAPVADLADAALGARVVATLENHSVDGGLGDLVADVLGGCRLAAPLLRLGVRERDFAPGSPSYLRERLGLDGASVARQVALRLSGG